MRMILICVLLLEVGCTLNVDYAGTYYQCNPDGSCPPGHECVDMLCVPSDPVPPACSKDVSAGGNHACSVREDGSVWCWGRNDYGQLGDGTATDNDEPVQVTGLVNAVQVGAGDIHTCALDAQGSVWCWGRNEAGQVGDGTNSDARTPVQVRDLVGVTAIAVGQFHSCALLGSGGVSCWGAGTDGQLGDGGMTNRPTAGAAMLMGARKITAGGDTTCAIMMDGSAQCWGENNDGELGVGDTMVHNRPTPVVDIAMLVDIAGADDFTCAVDMLGAAYCWGVNDDGELGNGTTMNSTRPERVEIPVGIVDLDGGYEHMCAKDGNGYLWCWGYGGEGRLMDSGSSSTSLPVRSTLENIDIVSAGGEHTCVLDTEGAIRCGGYNRRGQLGDGRKVTYGEPQLVQGLTNAVKVAAGGEHSCASLADGRVMCWGGNGYGSVGNGTFQNDVTIPTQVWGISNPKELVAGDHHTCALMMDNTAYCWGRNQSGQLGDETTMDSSQPRAVGDAFTHLSVADNATCGLVSGGAQCWGNQFGVAMPTIVADVTSIAGGGSHICSVQMDNTVLCYGTNSNYQLGNGTQIGQGAPGVSPTNLMNVAEVQARGNSSCAKLNDGSIKCWGLNDGRFGFGTGMNNYYANTPGNVMGLTGIMKLAMGWDSSCGLKADGALWCWGFNYSGQAGDGTYVGKASPVQLLSLTGVKDIAVGGSHSCAINGDGTVWCWGSAASGQIGNGIRLIVKPVGVRMTCPMD